MKRSYFGLLFCLAFFAALALSAADARTGEAVAGKVLRFHVLAASDAPADQARKLMVRDAVLAELSSLPDCATAQEAAAALAPRLDHLEALAESVLTDNGGYQPVTAALVRESFPQRSYEEFTLPAGTYAALRLSIGPGAGRNWWCVVFPPLCMAAVEEEDADEAYAVFSEEEKRLITGEGRVIRFKLLEWLEDLGDWFS